MFVYLRRNVLIVLCLGILSGIPLALTSSVLSAMLTQYGIDIKTIGLFAIVGLPYSFKFLWAPLLDNMKVPYLSGCLGRRRAQLVLISSLLAIAIAMLGQTSPQNYILYTALAALVVAFMSASQDIVIDALRIEMLQDDEQAAGASMIVNGYRLGMIVSSAGSLYLAHFNSWPITYLGMALILSIAALISIVLYKESPYIATVKKYKSWGENFIHSFIDPLKDIYSRTRFWYVLLFIVFFKLSDALIMSLTTPFLLHVGFDLLDIANVSKTFGIMATIAGGLVGGYIGNKLNPLNFIRISLILEMVSNLSYLLLIYTGPEIQSLFVVVSIENICSGISTAALVAYMSQICNKNFPASQYAALSAFASLGRTFISGFSGFIVEAFTWSIFFFISAAASLPALLLSKKALKK